MESANYCSRYHDIGIFVNDYLSKSLVPKFSKYSTTAKIAFLNLFVSKEQDSILEILKLISKKVPCSKRIYPFNFKYKQHAEEYFLEMIKKDDSLRLCVDFRIANEDDDIWKTSFRTPKGSHSPNPDKLYKLETCFSKFDNCFELSQKVCRVYRYLEYLLLGASHPIDIYSYYRNLLFNGKRVDVAGKVASDVANNVVATYKCSVGAATEYALSNCELNGNQLPTCAVSAAEAQACYTGVKVGSYCVTTGGTLLQATTATNCAAVSGSVNDVFYFNDEFLLLPVTPVMSEMKYEYLCASASAADCAPVIVNTVGEVDVSGNVAKVCLTASDTTVVSVTESVVGYYGITVATPDDFPGATNGVLTDTKVTGKNSIVKIPYKEAELGVCTNTGGSGTPPATTGVKCKINPGSGDVEVAACRKTGANKEIHYTNGSDCKALTGTGQTTAMYYFKKDYEKIATVTSTSQISYAYSCMFGKTKDAADQVLTSCAAVYGYTVSGDVAVACSGVVGSECVVQSLFSSCTATSGDATLGKSGDRYFLCFGKNKYDLPTGTDTDVVAFASDTYHEGLGSYGVTFLKLTKDTVKVDASSFTAGYRVNPSATGLKKALIHCETANTLSSCTLVDAVNGYYKSALGNEYVIRCDGSACKSEKVDHTTCGYDNLLPPCTNTDTSKQCIDDPESSTNVYYAYQCRFNAAGVANACTFAKGVTITATKSVYCNGWKNDICTVITSSGASSCSSGGEGGITTNAAGICIGSNAVEFPKDGYRYAAFTTSKLNTIYGVEKGEVVLLKLTPTAALLIEYTGVETIYLLDQANSKNDDDKKPLIQCIADDGCVAVASGTQDKVMGATANDVTKAGIIHAYYVDGAFPNGEQIITCEQSVQNDKGEVTTQKTCSSAAPGVSYYVSGVGGGLITCDTEANPTGFGFIPTCEYGEQAVNPCITNAVTGSLCVKKGKLYKTASVNSCVAVKTCKRTGASTFGLYYTGGSVANEKIILCDKKDNEDGEISCQYKDDVTTCVKDEKPDGEGEILYEDNSFKICDYKDKRDLNSPIEGYMLMDLTRAKEIFPGATSGMLIENKGTAMVEVIVKDGYYYNVENPASTVIQCTESDGCAVVAVKDKYCVGATHLGNKLPKCITDAADDSHCIKDGKIYRSSSGDTKCTEITAIETCSVESISEDAGCTEGSYKICIKSGKYYISDYNYCIAASSITTTFEQIKSDKKCVADAEVNALCRSGNDIYKSNDNDCEFVATTLDPVSTITVSFNTDYTKATAVNDIASVYKCTQRASVLSNCVRSEREPGEIVYTASNTSEVCVNTNGESQSITTPLFDPYLSIYTEKFDAFPGNTLPDTHVLYFSKYRLVLMRERSTLSPCDIISNGNQCHINSNQIKYFMTNGNQCHSNGYPVKYCLMNNNAIYQSTSNSCDMMSGTAGSTAFYFFANANKQIEEVDIYSHVEFVYKCRFGFGEVKRCGVMKGYVITNNHIVNCNGWADCTVTPLNSLSDTCADTREGQLMGNGAALCITESKSIALPTDNKTKYVMFQAGPTSPYYGQHQGKPILLALTARSVTVVDGGEEVKRGYYQNVKVSGDIANALVFCATDGDMDSCHMVNGLNGYYLSQDSDRDTFPVIRCERYLGCWKQSVDAACSGNGSLTISGSTVTLCGATTTLSTSATSATYKSLSGVVAAFPGVIEENVVVVKIGKDGSVLLLEDGIHLNENVSGVMEKAVYKCTTSTNGITSTCTASNAGYGYYRNAGSVGYQDQFLACSINGCQAILVDANAKCDVKSVGQLVGSSPTLCLNFNSGKDEPDGIEINNDVNKGAYMVAYNLSNIFGLEEDNYAYVDVDSESVLLKNDFKSYVYTDGQKEDTNDLYPDANELNKKYEFKYVNYGIYELNCEDDDERELCHVITNSDIVTCTNVQ
ncbi:hypothetical protein PIROE2DRAFT_9097 [Piromyces sp. E2]|nr:hypothetical protein PIROE2DRAFT_9097 [Piromyces sp. E2]|eukprot:OUM64195.1 hypothetical protein PIROE2DRAFT_9097 [Piromyces sp. E2]